MAAVAKEAADKAAAALEEADKAAALAAVAAQEEEDKAAPLSAVAAQKEEDKVAAVKCCQYMFLMLTCAVLGPKWQKMYLESLASNGLRVHAVDKDGNCMFRSISHQIYGDDSHHALIRSVCIDYMVINVYLQFLKNVNQQ